MSYKIAFSDIDGTLLNKDRELSPSTIQEVKKLHSKVPFILISSRMPAAMRHLQTQMEIDQLPIIAYNGGLVIINNEVVSSTEISLDIVESLCDYNNSINCHLSLYNHDEWLVPEMDYWALREYNNTKVKPEVRSVQEIISSWKASRKGAHKIMAMGEKENIDLIRDYLENTYPEQLHLYRSKDTYLEIAHKSISKFTAIEILLKHYDLTPQDAVAFGDNYNDIEMLSNVGYGIAVGNARDEVKKISNHITDLSIEDGVAKSLNQLFNFE